MNSFAVSCKNLWKSLPVAAALAFLYGGVLARLTANWWTDENYSHGLLVPFVIGFIVWSERERLGEASESPNFWLGGALVGLAILLLLGGTLGAELFAQRVSFVVMLAGVVVYFFGAGVLRGLAAPFALLLLSIPLPLLIFNKIAFPLQLWASQAAVWGVRLFDVPTVRQGNVIEILPRGATQIVALEVVEACSGIRSLMTLAALALVLAYFTGRRSDDGGGGSEEGARGGPAESDFWRAAALVLAAVPIAILTNAARVAATGVLTFYYGKRAAEGAWHEWSGWLVYVLAFGLLVAANLVWRLAGGRLRRGRQAISATPGGRTDEIYLTE